MIDSSNNFYRKLAVLWRVETGIFLGLWLLLMVFVRNRFFRDPGTFWHTVTGAKILSSRRFLATDPYSFTFAGEPWTPYEWLAECAMAGLHAIGGFDSLLLATATALAGLYAWLAQRLIRAGLHWMPTVLIVVLATAAGASNFHARPHIVTMVFLGITFALLIDFEAGLITTGRLFWLVPLFFFWTNCHGGMPGGLATLILFVVGWCLTRIMRRCPLSGDGPRLGLLVLACGLTAFLNPYGARLPQTWLRIMSSPVIPRIIEEHRPPAPWKLDFWMIIAPGLIYVAALAGTIPRRPRVVWLIPLVWFGLALTRVRHAPLFGITAVLALADMLPETRLAAWLARPGRDLFRFPGVETRFVANSAWSPVALPLILFLAVLAFQATGLRAPVIGRGWVKLDPELWPVDLLPELRRYETAGVGNGRIFNDFQFGGFLIYHTPGLKVFIDDRCELYGDQSLIDFYEASRYNPRRIEDWAKRYRFDLALVTSGSAFDRYLNVASGWTLVRRTGAAALYRRSATADGAPS